VPGPPCSFPLKTGTSLCIVQLVSAQQKEQLDFPDNHVYRAAAGYYSIGCYLEASEEIEKISEKNTCHPEVLRLKGSIYWSLRDIERALEASNMIIAQAPAGRTFEYIFNAMLLSYQGKGREAYDLLLKAAHLLQNHSSFLYDLAKYAAQCGLRDEALHWVRMALSARPDLRDSLLRDSQLAPYRSEIEAICPQNPS
jgi:tetratricopeptide (TPR) repeat protein